MSFLMLPPEVNSALIYTGAGASPLYLAAAAWDGVTAELLASASSFDAVIATLTDATSGTWSGSASLSMAAVAATYVGWMRAAAGQTESASGQARAAAGMFEAALTATVHPAAVAANRVSLMSLVATNFLGQNTPAIAATELDYEEMWAQDAAAMAGYHADAVSVAAALPALAVPPVNVAGLVSQAVGAIPSALQSVASAVPVESLSSLVQVASVPVSLLLSPIMSLAQSANGAGLAATAGLAADVPTLAGDVTTGLTPVSGGGLGSAISAGVGQGRLVGAMSVPPSWASSTAPSRTMSSTGLGLGAVPDAAATAGATGGPGGMPMMPMPMGGAGAAGGMLGRGGSHTMQQRPSVIPRTGIG